LYDGSVKMGNLNADWILFKEDNETDSTYDFFTVQTNYEVANYSYLYYYKG